jgi:hypothetical protein
MTQPEGFPQGERGQLLKLRKSLYGLKQARRQWNKKLSAKLCEMGFQCLQSDRSCYIYSDGAVRIILPIYVDDGMICAKDDADIDRVIAQLGSSFTVKDLGPTEWLLGIKIERDSNTGDIHLLQRYYTPNPMAAHIVPTQPSNAPTLPPNPALANPVLIFTPANALFMVPTTCCVLGASEIWDVQYFCILNQAHSSNGAQTAPLPHCCISCPTFLLIRQAQVWSQDPGQCYSTCSDAIIISNFMLLSPKLYKSRGF